MAPELGVFENWYFTVFLIIIIGVIVVSYRLTHPDYENFSMSLIFLAVLGILMLFVPLEFLWLMFLGFFIILFNIIISSLLNKFFIIEEDKLLIDKPPQVWETFEIPPETKEAQI